MKIVIDTSSLLSLVRYYLPFDQNQNLFEFFKTKIESGEIIIIDKVFDEAKYIAKGIIIEKLKYLDSKKLHQKTTEILPDKKFFNQLENQFCNASWKNQLEPSEFENRKSAYLESADAKMILFALKEIKLGEDVIMVSEESGTNNDNKAFKKIPAICKQLAIEIKTLPELIKYLQGIEVSFQ